MARSALHYAAPQSTITTKPPGHRVPDQAHVSTLVSFLPGLQVPTAVLGRTPAVSSCHATPERQLRWTVGCRACRLSAHRSHVESRYRSQLAAVTRWEQLSSTRAGQCLGAFFLAHVYLRHPKFLFLMRPPSPAAILSSSLSRIFSTLHSPSRRPPARAINDTMDNPEDNPERRWSNLELLNEADKLVSLPIRSCLGPTGTHRGPC